MSVPIGSIIYSSGLKRVETILPGDLIQPARTVKNLLPAGKKRLFAVNLANSREFRCSMDQNLAIVNSLGGNLIFRPAPEIEIGDTLLLSAVPVEMGISDPDYAYLHGVFHGKGTIFAPKNGDGEFTILFQKTEAGKAMADRIAFALRSKFTDEARLERYDALKGTFYGTCRYSAAIAALIVSRRGIGRPHILPWIYELDADSRGAYLAGLLDSTGDMYAARLGESKHFGYMKEVQQLVSSLGCDSQIEEIKGKVRYRPNHYGGRVQSRKYRLVIRGKVSFENIRERLQPHCFTPLPKTVMFEESTADPNLAKRALDRREITKLDYRSLIFNTDEGLSHHRLIPMNKKFWRTHIPVRVISVIDLATSAECFDLDVDGNTYFADGVLVGSQCKINHEAVENIPSLSDFSIGGLRSDPQTGGVFPEESPANP